MRDQGRANGVYTTALSLMGAGLCRRIAHMQGLGRRNCCTRPDHPRDRKQSYRPSGFADPR
jgi:hypothetical protein